MQKNLQDVNFLNLQDPYWYKVSVFIFMYTYRALLASEIWTIISQCTGAEQEEESIVRSCLDKADITFFYILSFKEQLVYFFAKLLVLQEVRWN